MIGVLGRLMRRARPSVPPDSVVYAVGDIHGRLDLLLELETAIRADAARRGAARRVIVHLGDYVDRGPESRGVVGHLAAGPGAGFEMVALLGNHERMMLDVLDAVEPPGAWLANGGGATLASYGVGPVDRRALGAVDALALGAALRDALPAAHRAFLRALAPSHREGDFLFVHAGIRPGIALEDQIEDDLLWIREPFLSANTDHGCVVVHGHSIVAAPVFRSNRIGIDTGAFRTGVLTALAIEGDRVEMLQAGAPAPGA